jgi:hypothetical protein
MDPTGTMPGQGLDEPFGDLDGLGFLSREEEQATRLRVERARAGATKEE